MIYEINSTDIEYCLANDCYCICVSNDSMTALISSQEEITNIEILGEHQQTEINEIMMLEKWQKECKDCI